MRTRSTIAEGRAHRAHDTRAARSGDGLAGAHASELSGSRR